MRLSRHCGNPRILHLISKIFMLRRVVVFFFFAVTSCSTKPETIDQNIEITIEDAQSYKYDLSKHTYSISRIFKPDTTIHFKLSTAETEQIISKYYELELDLFRSRERIEDNCMIMPKLYTTVKVKSKHDLQ